VHKTGRSLVGCVDCTSRVITGLPEPSLTCSLEPVLARDVESSFFDLPQTTATSRLVNNESNPNRMSESTDATSEILPFYSEL
jgi:hypothetical protein